MPAPPFAADWRFHRASRPTGSRRLSAPSVAVGCVPAQSCIRSLRRLLIQSASGVVRLADQAWLPPGFPAGDSGGGGCFLRSQETKGGPHASQACSRLSGQPSRRSAVRGPRPGWRCWAWRWLAAPSSAGAGVDFSGASEFGTKVFFETDEQLAATDTDSSTDVYERSGGATTQVSQGAINGNGANDVLWIGASSDGTKVFFQTSERLAATDTDSNTDVYQRSGGGYDAGLDQHRRHGERANNATFDGASDDGTKVFFTTNEQLAATDTDSSFDVYQRSGGVTTQVSTNTAGTANGGERRHLRRRLERRLQGLLRDHRAAGRHRHRLELRRLRALRRVTTQVSTNTAGTANGANTAVLPRRLGADGSKVFFETDEQLAATDTDSSFDVYQRSGGVTTQVSTNTAGTANAANSAGFDGASSDGSKVFFETDEQLAASDTDSSLDVYQRSGGVTTQVSTNTAGTANGANQRLLQGRLERRHDGLLPHRRAAGRRRHRRGHRCLPALRGATAQISTNNLGTGSGASECCLRRRASDCRHARLLRDRRAAGRRRHRLGHRHLPSATAGRRTQVSTNTAGTTTAGGVATFRGAFERRREGLLSRPTERLTDTDTDSVTDLYERSGGAPRSSCRLKETAQHDDRLRSIRVTGDPTPTFSFSSDEPSTFECRGWRFAQPPAPRPSPPACSPTDPTASRFAPPTSPPTPIRPRRRAASRSTPPHPDTVAPNTKITKLSVNSTKHKATVRFKGTDPAPSSLPLHFKCKIDKKPFTACSSPKTYKHLKVGKHKFRVKARDAAGNVDLTPAVKGFRIKP